MSFETIDTTDVRFVGRISGRYTLPGRKPRNGMTVFACQTQSMTPQQILVSAPVIGNSGEPVSANFEELGLVHGYVSRKIDGGFAIEVDEGACDVARLAARVAWVKKRITAGVTDERSHKRVIPRNPHSTLVLADGKLVRCFVVDMSASGAAISANLRPPLGTALAVGRVIGRVVRRLDVGFAVKFIAPQPLENIEQSLFKSPQELA